VLACWPLVPKFAGSNPAEAVRFLRTEKSSARLPAACKRSLNVPWKSASRQNYRSLFPPISFNFRRWSAEGVGRRGGIWWPKFERPKRAVQYARSLQYTRGLPRTPRETKKQTKRVYKTRKYKKREGKKENINVITR
jgi:hypothetical protein